MSDWGYSGGSSEFIGYPSVTLPAGAGGVTNFGAWTQIVASTPFEAKGIMISAGISVTDYGYVNIGIGVAGAETKIIGGFFVYGNGSGWQSEFIEFPITIPAGSRLSAQISSNGAHGGIVSAALRGGSFTDESVMGSISNYAAAAAVTVSATGTSAWTQITASTTEQMEKCIFQFCQYPSNGNFIIGTADIAVGAAGSETIVLSNIPVTYSNSSLVTSVSSFKLHLSIPKGSRVSWRYNCTTYYSGTSYLFCTLLGGM